MEFGRIVEATKTNEEIYRFLGYLSESDQGEFVEKFRKQPHDEVQVFHTFRELQLGAYLRSEGFWVEPERKINSKTPDWCILDGIGNLSCVIEMVYHHLDLKTQNYLASQKREGKTVFAYFPHANDHEYIRLYANLQKKATYYKELIEQANVPYVIAVYCDFLAVIDIEELQECLFECEAPIFSQYPHISGVMYFEEHTFRYILNPDATRTFNLPSGYF